ncbi:Protein AEXR-1 [Aphelenchoides avenae]|nr:Protein AEXR-1 [Aphelenchus avenae]
MGWPLVTTFVGYVWAFDVIYIQNDENCVLLMSDGKAHFYQVFTTFFCVLPVVSSLALSVYLFQLTKRRRATLNLARRQTNSSTLKLKLESLAFIFATTLWTACSLLPYRVFNVCRIYLFNVLDDCEWTTRFNWLGWSLMYLLQTNAIVNPFITLFVYAPYRRTLCQLMTPCKDRRQPSTVIT